MRLVRLLLPLLVLLVVALPAAAQPKVPAGSVRVEGLVLDRATSRPVPGATVVREGSNEGVTADARGRFVFVANRLPVSLRVSAIGYAPGVLRVERADAPGLARREVLLAPADVEAAEVEVVASEDRGLRLMRRVAARRTALRRLAGSYTQEAYARAVVRGTLPNSSAVRPVRLVEAFSLVYARPDGRRREDVAARRRTPSGGPFRHADTEAAPDVYFEDTFTLDGFQPPSPLDPRAFDAYSYRLGADTLLGGRPLVDVSVQPRRPGWDAFTGRLRIDTRALVVVEAEWRPPLPPPGAFLDFAARYRVTYAPVTDSLWLLDRFERTVRVWEGSAASSVPPLEVTQTTTFSAPDFVDGGPDAAFASPDRYHNPTDAYPGRDAFVRFRDERPLSSDEIALLDGLQGRTVRGLVWREGLIGRYLGGTLDALTGRTPGVGVDDPPRAR